MILVRTRGAHQGPGVILFILSGKKNKRMCVVEVEAMVFAKLFKYWQPCRDSMNSNFTLPWGKHRYLCLCLCVHVYTHSHTHTHTHTHTHSHITSLCVTAQDLDILTSALNDIIVFRFFSHSETSQTSLRII